jgi:hypothetical protein
MNYNRLKVIDNDYQFTYQSKAYNNGNFNYRIFINIIDYGKCTDMEGFGINVTVAKTVRYISKKQLEGIVSCFCFGDKKDVSDYDVYEYGYSATIESNNQPVKTLNEAHAIAKEFQNKIPIYTSLIGFYLDKPQNRIGNNGWDFLSGNIGFN